jgi:CRP-like cAMP-binding protein
MSTDAVAALRKVEFLSALDDATLGELAARAHVRRYRQGERIVGELEFGADVYVITEGEAEVSVEPRKGERQTLGKLGVGSAVGEMSSLTGELRSATVTALGNVEVLVIADADFDRLRERRPEVAVSLVRVLAARLSDAERALDTLLEPAATSAQRASIVAPDPGGAGAPRRGSLSRAWRELVVNHKRDLAFLTFVAFVLTLVVVRLVVYASFRFEVSPMQVLRALYITGFALLGVSSCAALLTFSPAWRRAIAIAYGVGVALIFNQLGVTLAFDIFYKDIFTPDPTVAFDVERLYRRTESLRAIAIGLVVLVQAAYLRPFYRRAFFVLSTRARKLVSKRS